MASLPDPEYDIGNLVCLDTAAFTPRDSTTIDEDIRLRAQKNVQGLIGRIFVLPTEPPPYGNGRVATLPTPTTKLPREKPVPKPREQTTWEKFAKLKGIQKRKKDKIVFDETKQEWRRTYGYKKANDINETWAIPAKAGENDGMDPWERAMKEKKERVDHNKKRQLQNLQAASGHRVPGTIDLAAAAASRKKGKKRKKNQPHHVDVALEVSQKSTASMGKFDKLNRDEPAVKKSKKLKAKIVGRTGGNKVNVNKAINIAQQEEEAKKRAKKGKAGKKKKSKQMI
eukprot:jgi/Bigna1/146013/aug1.107_g20721